MKSTIPLSTHVTGDFAFPLTCILPFRLRPSRHDGLDRLEYARMDAHIPASVTFLVIDDGSQEGDLVREKCRELGYGYHRLDTEGKEFSISRCRNAGAVHATTKYIFMQDVDLMTWDGFYEALLQEIEIQGLEANCRRFLMVPYIFLTEEGTEVFQNSDRKLRKAQAIQQTLVDDKRYVEKHSCGTSANLYNRQWYLSRGGNCEDFEGWGYEDLEFNCRMVSHHANFYKPKNWSAAKYNFNTVVSYETWKAPYRLYGDLLWNKGIVLLHAWHVVDRANDQYYLLKERNGEVFAAKLMAFKKQAQEPPPLPDNSRGKTLLMRRNAFTCARDFAPLLGHLVDLPDAVLQDPSQLSDFVRTHGITRLVFHNPFASPEMLALYQQAKREQIPLFVAERGALPGSFFFDPSGFLCDGDSYEARHWDHPLDENQRAQTEDYLADLLASEETLEAQNPRISAQKLRSSLRVPDGRKILLVVLQRPTDTVTRFFCGEIGTYANFLEMLRQVADSLPPEWTMVIKQHPLEDGAVKIPSAVQATTGHLHDLLAISQAILTFNSGVGVLGIAWNLPVFVAGKAYYGDSRLVTSTPTAALFLEGLRKARPPEAEARLRFFHYLVYEFYSFGEFVTKPVRMPDGSRMTATTDIRCREVRMLVTPAMPFHGPEEQKVPWTAPLYERYRMAGAIRRRIKRKDTSWGDFPPAREEDVHALLAGYVAPPVPLVKRLTQPIRHVLKWIRKRKKMRAQAGQ